MVTIAVDTREQAPWGFGDLEGVELVRKKLDTGDYSIVGLEDRVCIERKSLDDWVGTVMTARDRFYREVERMRRMDFAAVIVEGSVEDVAMGRYTSRAHPSSVFGFAAELTVRRGVPVFFAGDRVQAQLLAGKLLAFYAAG